MNKNTTVSTSQIVTSIANRFTELPKKLTKEIISSFLEVIEKEVSEGNKVRIDHIGILQAKDRAARKGRNPQTGEVIEIPASKKISFRASKTLKERVLGATENVKKGSKSSKK